MKNKEWKSKRMAAQYIIEYTWIYVKPQQHGKQKEHLKPLNVYVILLLLWSRILVRSNTREKKIFVSQDS